ncbi:hypothetical protein [Streptomyces adonidis]|uniref:hypothetical protein n=1 Tax=Streptomyces adonidis TaxID=3231367 RepID=UPI0034DAD3A7
MNKKLKRQLKIFFAFPITAVIPVWLLSHLGLGTKAAWLYLAAATLGALAVYADSRYPFDDIK